MGALFCCERTKSEDAKAAAAKNAGFITSDRRKCTDVLCLVCPGCGWRVTVFDPRPTRTQLGLARLEVRLASNLTSSL